MSDGRPSLVPSTHLQLNSLAIGQRTCALTFVAAHSPRRCDPGENTHLHAIYCVLHALRRCLVTKLTPWECQHSTFLMCFERFERISGNQMDFFVVLHQCHVPASPGHCVFRPRPVTWVHQTRLRQYGQVRQSRNGLQKRIMQISAYGSVRLIIGLP